MKFARFFALNKALHKSIARPSTSRLFLAPVEAVEDVEDVEAVEAVEDVEDVEAVEAVEDVENMLTIGVLAARSAEPLTPGNYCLRASGRSPYAAPPLTRSTMDSTPGPVRSIASAAAFKSLPR